MYHILEHDAEINVTVFKTAHTFEYVDDCYVLF